MENPVHEVPGNANSEQNQFGLHPVSFPSTWKTDGNKHTIMKCCESFNEKTGHYEKRTLGQRSS